MSGELFDMGGRRKYLTVAERQAFLAAAQEAPREVRTLCGVLVHTGCRISEALALTADRVDLVAGTITLETLKKRKRGVYRAVPVPPALLDTLELVHRIRQVQKRKDGGSSVRLWPWARSTAWLKVREVMGRAGVSGPQATPKGLRHGFGMAAVEAKIPLNIIQRWLGHAQLSTTCIYLDAVGAEEKSLAARMWG